MKETSAIVAFEGSPRKLGDCEKQTQEYAENRKKGLKESFYNGLRELGKEEVGV